MRPEHLTDKYARGRACFRDLLLSDCIRAPTCGRDPGHVLRACLCLGGSVRCMNSVIPALSLSVLSLKLELIRIDQAM